MIGFRFGVEYGDFLGHRGLTHSIPFAAALAGVILGIGLRQGVPGLPARRLAMYLFLATASHGLLDALTDGGLGVALLAPFDNTRYFFPIRPIRVSPIGVLQFFTDRGRAVLASEVAWVWLPSALLAFFALSFKRGSRSRAAA